jgi:transposase
MIWIGVDAHKRVHQAVALGTEGVVARRVAPNSQGGWIELLAWAGHWPERSWAIEGSGSLGRGLAQFLAGQHEQVREVSPRWTAHRRRTMRRLGKSDPLDAQTVAQLLREEGAHLPLVQAEDPTVAAVQLWSRLREDLVHDMTQVRNRLHALLLVCDPEYQDHMPALRNKGAVRLLRAYMAPGSSLADRAREQAIRRLAEQLSLLTEHEQVLYQELKQAIRASFAPLLSIPGVGTLVAAGLIAELGMPRPGFGPAQLAALAGVAPLEASSAGAVRHRLSRRGNRRLNRLFYHIALIQEATYPPAQAYVARRQQQGHTAREARRTLKRQLVRRVWHQWQACWPLLPAALHDQQRRAPHRRPARRRWEEDDRLPIILRSP